MMNKDNLQKEALRKAAKEGDFKTAKRLLIKENPQIDEETFFLSCRSKNERVVKLLLDLEGKGHSFDRTNPLPLQIACMDCSINIIKTLSTHGWVIDKSCYNAAVDSKSSLSVVLFLIADHGDMLKNSLTVPDILRLYCLPFVQAFQNSDRMAIEQLIAFGEYFMPSNVLLQHLPVTADNDLLLDCLKKYHKTTLRAIAVLLVEHGYPISAEVACASVHKNDEDLVCLLLSRGWNSFVTPLLEDADEQMHANKSQWISRKCHFDMIYPPKRQKTGLNLAVEAAQFHLVEIMVLHGVGLDWWMLQALIESKDYRLVKRFVEIYPSMMQQYTTLYTAICTGCLPIVKLLLNHGASSPHYELKSAAIQAFRRGDAVMVVYIIQHFGLSIEQVTYTSSYKSKAFGSMPYLKVAAEVGEAVDIMTHVDGVRAELLPYIEELEMDVNCVNNAHLLHMILDEKESSQIMFHQVSACGHSLFTNWKPETMRLWNLSDPFPADIKRLCRLSKDDDVANAIVRCIDCPLWIRSVYVRSTQEYELTDMYATDKEGNVY